MPKQTLIVTTPQGDQEVDVEVPTASVPEDTWSKGFHEALKTDEPYAGMVYGAAKGVLPGAVKGAWETLKFLPYTVPKALLTAGSALYTDPVGTLTSLRDTLKNAPQALKDAHEQAIQFAATDPEAFGQQLGELGGSFIGGAAASKIPLKAPIRLTGRTLEYAGEHPFVARMSGGAMLGRGVLKGNPVTAAAGVATMAVPKLLTATGRALREFGGDDLSTALPSGARTVDVGDVRKLKGGIRVAPPGPSTGGRLAYPAATEPMVPVLKESGARTLDVGDITGLGDAPPGGGSATVPYGGSSTGPAPYRASAKAAVKNEEILAAAKVKADQNAARLAEIERRKTGLVPKRPTVSESLSATTPEGGRASSSVRFAPPKKVDLVPAGPPLITLPGGQVLQRSDNPVIYDAIQAERTRNVGRLRETPPQTPPSALPDAPGRDVGRVVDPERRTLTGTSPTGTERRAANARALAEQEGEGIVPPTRDVNGAAQVDAAVQQARQGGVRTTPPAPKERPLDLSKFITEHADEIEHLSTPEGGGFNADRLTTELRRQYPGSVLHDYPAEDVTHAIGATRQGPRGLMPAGQVKGKFGLADIEARYGKDLSNIKSAPEAYDMYHGVGKWKTKPNVPMQNVMKPIFDRRFPGWDDPETWRD